MADTEQSELASEARAAWLVAGIAPGWRFISAGGKTPSIDGYIQIRDQILNPTSRNYLNLAVQVKSGRSCFHVPKRQTAKFGYLDVKPTHVNQWKASNIPVIVVWDEEPTSIDARVLWTHALHAKRNARRLKVRLKATFGRGARRRLLSIARDHAGHPEIASLGARPPLFPSRVSEVKAKAWDFYTRWRREGSTSRALGPVAVTLKGWRHMTQPSYSQLSIVHKLGLLACAREVIEKGGHTRFLREIGGPSHRKLWAVVGISRPPHQAPIIIETVLEELSIGDRRVVRFYSVHERIAW